MHDEGRGMRAEGIVPRVVALAAAACFAVLAGAQSSVPADGISWREARPLTWDDFRGPADPAAPPTTVAMTAAALTWTYSYELERGARGCRYRITGVESEAVFDPSASWARAEHRNAGVLEHEQGHFDLTQVHKLMLDRAAGALVGEYRECGRRASQSDVEAAVARAVEPIRERIWNNLQQAQARYDAETRHGISREAQRDWSERIRRALRSGRWDGHDSAVTGR